MLAETVEKESGQKAEPEQDEEGGVHRLANQAAHPQHEPDRINERVDQAGDGDGLVLALELELVGLRARARPPSRTMVT